MLDDRFRSMRRHSTLRDFGVGFPNSVRRFRSFMLIRSYLSCTKFRFFTILKAVEHEDPYAFDSFVYVPRMRFKNRAYIDIDNTSWLSYIRAALSLFPQYGLTAFVALHLDVRSRHAGGSSAPAWTLEQEGFAISVLSSSSRSSALFGCPTTLV